LPRGNDQATQAFVVFRRPITDRNVHAQIAFDRGLSLPSPSDCSGSARHGRDRLAAIDFMIGQLQWAGYGAALAASA